MRKNIISHGVQHLTQVQEIYLSYREEFYKAIHKQGTTSDSVDEKSKKRDDINLDQQIAQLNTQEF